MLLIASGCSSNGGPAERQAAEMVKLQEQIGTLSAKVDVCIKQSAGLVKVDEKTGILSAKVDDCLRSASPFFRKDIPEKRRPEMPLC